MNKNTLYKYKGINEDSLMGLKVLNPLIKTVAKKAYAAPQIRVSTLESLGQMEQLGDIVHIDRIKIAKNKLASVLQSEHCKMPDFMSGVPNGASEEDTIKLLKQMFEESKFFSRECTNEIRYGKNFEWAKKMFDIHTNASDAITKDTKFENVISLISKKYSCAEWKNLSDGYGASRINSGVYRGNIPDTIFGDVAWGPVTGYGGRGVGKNGGYPKYCSRLDSVGESIKSPYKDFSLTCTSPSDYLIMHPTNSQVKKNMEIIAERYKIYQKLVAEYKKTGTLNPEQKTQTDNIISEIYYLMAHTMPFERGSNGISDILMRSQYAALGINKPHIKQGVGLDLEAFCMNLDEYKIKWNNFFEL